MVKDTTGLSICTFARKTIFAHTVLSGIQLAPTPSTGPGKKAGIRTAHKNKSGTPHAYRREIKGYYRYG